MATVRVHLTYPKGQISEPIVYYLGCDFDLVTNIHRANVTAEEGWIVLELSGTREDIERGIEWLRSRGVEVEAIQEGEGRT